ncbi:MAG: hypothetical protein C0606_03580 [Hyphomicrobiales bacterium]|nr:MAG: hypothetical protein C0606_03580 [Hyphomicrobiales bacterium]
MANDAAQSVLVIGCGALAREINAVLDAGGWGHVTLTCLPAQLHNTPDRIPEAARAAIRAGRDKGFSRILVAYADCGTGGQLDRVVEEEGATRLAGPHCYSFFSGNEAFAKTAEDEIATFYLTDFLARQFDAMVVKPLGIDRHPELTEMYFGNYDRLVYLAQTDDPALTDKARAAADRLGLAFERRMTGYGDLETELRQFAGTA